MSNFYWEWFCSLFNTQQKQEIDPYEYRCKCGYKWKFNKLQLLWMFFHEDYVHTCPQCMRQSRYRMVSHVTRESDTDKIRRNNKWID